jgi:uncharacterized protein (TIGR02453 family)
MTFSGYTDESIAFLEALPGRDPDWFKANKASYESAVVLPTKAFVAAFGERLREDLPDIEAQPKTNGSIAPINNDLRFTPDASPYKDHVMLRFWQGAPKKTAPTLMVRLAPSGVGFAAGIIPSDVGRWREVIDSAVGAELADAVASLATAKKAEVVGEGLKNVPAPYAKDHPRGHLLRHKMLQVRWEQPLPKNVTKPAFVDWCAKQLEPAVPLHRLLVEAFQ